VIGLANNDPGIPSGGDVRGLKGDAKGGRESAVSLSEVRGTHVVGDG
jgi:hypothetical protein